MCCVNFWDLDGGTVEAFNSWGNSWGSRRHKRRAGIPHTIVYLVQTSYHASYKEFLVPWPLWLGDIVMEDCVQRWKGRCGGMESTLGPGNGPGTLVKSMKGLLLP